jgi:ABC-2 type transport system permease protein
MTLTAEPWPAYAERAASRPGSGTLVVWRLELAKLSGQLIIRLLAVAAVIGPFLVGAVLNVQSSTPGDTPFGQWVHSSGLAVPMFTLGFGAQWCLPVLTAIVAGGMYSSEDHFGTWKTVLTRSRTRGELFAGKFLAAVTFAVVAMAVLTITNLAGLLYGTQPLVGLGGQLVTAGHAIPLIVASWLSELPPVLAFTALAIFLSVVSRNSVVGIGGPVLIAIVLQVVTLVNLPVWGQMVLPSTPFMAWHGFWTQPAFYGPFLWGLAVSAGWFVVLGGLSWLVFRRRTIGVAS